MTDRIRVLIADDHPVFRDGLRALVESAPDLELAGEATTGTQAVDLAATGRRHDRPGEAAPDRR